MRRVAEASSGKTWTTSVRRLISRLSPSMGLCGADLLPVGAGLVSEGGEVDFGVGEHLGDLGEGRGQGGHDLVVGVLDGLWGGLGEDGGDESVDGLGVGGAQGLGDVASEVDAAALPGGTSEDGFDSVLDTLVGVTGDDLHSQWVGVG